MPISSYIDHSKNLATFTAAGKLTLDEVMPVVKMFYDQPTKNVLWDLTAVSDLNFHLDEVREIASYQQRHESPIRNKGKTAIVASKDLIYGLGKMFQSLSEMSNVPFAVMIFRTMEEAEDWLED